MTQDQGTLFAVTPEQAVDAEIARVIRTAEQYIRDYAPSYRGWLMRVIRNVRPDITRERWREIASVDPDTSQLPEYQSERRLQAERDRAILRERGLDTCCPGCDRARVVGLEADGTVQPAGEAPETPERTCGCDECTEPACQGDCETCEDHGCEQCYPDGCPERYSCCGYCRDCEDHGNDPQGHSVCGECWHCSECDHYCDS